MYILDGITVLDLSRNIPGPVASARLRDWGARVIKIEPPGGDLLGHLAPEWYSELTEGKKVVRLDLKTDSGQEGLHNYLCSSDLLLTAMRPASLKRLNLDWDCLHRRYPDLCHVEILGYPPPEVERRGHDLTYQAAAGLLHPPAMPCSLLADLAGAERAVNASLVLLFHRQQAGQGAMQMVTLQEASYTFSKPLRYGLTSPGGSLGGGLARYGLYATRDGWIALAALEEHLWKYFLRVIERLDLNTESNERVRLELEGLFRQRSNQEWADLARQNNLPLEAVVEPNSKPRS